MLESSQMVTGGGWSNAEVGPESEGFENKFTLIPILHAHWIRPAENGFWIIFERNHTNLRTQLTFVLYSLMHRHIIGISYVSESINEHLRRSWGRKERKVNCIEKHGVVILAR